MQHAFDHSQPTARMSGVQCAGPSLASSRRITVPGGILIIIGILSLVGLLEIQGGLGG